MMGYNNLMLAGAAAAGAAAAIVALKLMERSRASTPQQPNRAPGALAAAGKLTRRGVQSLHFCWLARQSRTKVSWLSSFPGTSRSSGTKDLKHSAIHSLSSLAWVVLVSAHLIAAFALGVLHVVFVIAGSHCTNMLARAGAGKLRLVDFDQVTLSSLNRHAVATLADVGMPKASALKSHLQRIVPNCIIDERSAARGTEEPCLMNDLLRFTERKCSQSLQQTVFSLVFAERCFTARFLCCNVVHSGQANLTTSQTALMTSTPK